MLGGENMTRIPSESRDLMEKAIYFPMLIKVMERDLYIVSRSSFKLPNPYKQWIERTIGEVHMELSEVKREMKKQGMKVQEISRDETFTTFLFVYKGYEEHHNYFNPRLRNKVEELLAYYLFGRFSHSSV